MFERLKHFKLLFCNIYKLHNSHFYFLDFCKFWIVVHFLRQSARRHIYIYMYSFRVVVVGNVVVVVAVAVVVGSVVVGVVRVVVVSSLSS